MDPRRSINLLPPEVHEKQSQRAAWKYAVAILVAIVVLLGLITAYGMIQSKRVKDKADKQEKVAKELEQKNRDLDYLDQLEDQFTKQKQKVQGAWQKEISWAKVLQEIAAVMPEGVYLTSLQGTSGDEAAVKAAPIAQDVGGSSGAPPAAAPPKTQGSGNKLDLSQKTPLGSIQVNGTGRGHREVGNWLYRVNRGMPSLSLAWITSSQAVTVQTGTAAASTGVSQVTFQGSAYLTPYAMGWMGRCAALGFDNLAGRPEGTCGHSFYGGGSGSTGAKTPATPAATK